ncbi:hypothetical protein TIFTF001_021706 [Ficus carica]|uniref:NADH dehydrogenase subunit 4L n=1 Tax=Ficus carica TaxID=3494 RepID=A0AA88AIH6_FICCA|nr:hypothetical protein TIFTF001_021706 [Ficus carica]
MLMVIARVFHILVFEGISLASPGVHQSISPTLMVILSAALSLKACDDRALVFSLLCLGELEVLLAMSLSGDVCGLGATCYMLSMD